MTPHLKCLIETVQMRGHNICFNAELTKLNKLSPNTPFYLKFCHDLCLQKIQDDIKKQEEELLASTKDANNSNTNNSSVNADVIDPGNQGIFGTALANIFVIIGFAAFAYTVKCVLRSAVE